MLDIQKYFSTKKSKKRNSFVKECKLELTLQIILQNVHKRRISGEIEMNTDKN